MLRIRIVSVLTALVLVLGLAGTALALEVDCDTTYCFSADDFGTAEEPLAGICITGLPDAQAGTAMLGHRVLRTGDILTADQMAAMTFVPLLTQDSRDAVMTYLPIYQDRVAPSAEMTISIRGKEDKAPVAEDSTAETYKNLPNQGKLKATDPEGHGMTYSLIRQPKRGDVTLQADGTFTYTPKKNKVGVDSFTYTAVDPAGNVSREATVTITILKPTEKVQYKDTAGESCRFAAEWMKNTGIFVAEQVGGESCFQPEKTVTRGEFLTMLTKTLNLPMEEESEFVSYSEDTPQWLKPYLTAAARSGLLSGMPEAGNFGAGQAITGAEAALMLQNALDLAVTTQAEAEVIPTSNAKVTLADLEAAAQAEAEAAPAWAETALTALKDNGINLAANEALTRSQVAQTLYQASLLALDAPGMQVFQ